VNRQVWTGYVQETRLLCYSRRRRKKKEEEEEDLWEKGVSC